MKGKIQDNAGILCFPWGLPTSPLLGLMINPGTWSEEELLSHDLRLGLHPTHLYPPVSPSRILDKRPVLHEVLETQKAGSQQCL